MDMDQTPAFSNPWDEEAVWDEYRWEDLIRKQDARSDEYLAMLEYYGDDPDSHNLIARSMGWTHLLTNCKTEPEPDRCANCATSQRENCRFHQAYFDDDEEITPLAAELFSLAENQPPEEDPDYEAAEAEWNVRYGQHVIHTHTRALVARLSAISRKLPEPGPKMDGPLTRLFHHAHRCAGKVAAALRGYTEPESLGLTIAYLKMSYQSTCIALGQVASCTSENLLDEATAADMSRRLADIRSLLSELIADFRKQLSALLP